MDGQYLGPTPVMVPENNGERWSAAAMISWVRPDLNNSVMRFLRSMVEPVLTPVRKVLPPMGGLDFSVLAVLFVIYLLRAALASY